MSVKTLKETKRETPREKADREKLEQEAAAAAKREWERLEKDRAEAERKERERAAQIQKEALEKPGRSGMDAGPLTPNATGGMEMAAQAPAAPAASKTEHAKAAVIENSPAPDAMKAINAGANERYQVRRDIVLGGQGACKVAYDTLADREVIIKTSAPQAGWSAERIVKEARTAAKMNHPNCSRLLEMGSLGKDQVFMTMPFIEGSSLDTVLKKISDAGIPGLTGYSMTAAAELFNNICAGVEHAHANGILHLDLKPQNIIIGSKGEVVVIDWGISQPINLGEYPKRYASGEVPAAPTLTTTLTGSVAGDSNIRAIGTPAYMSPEQWAGDPGTLTERTDVYGLGGVLFFLLTGHAPNQIQRPTDLDPYFRHSPVPSPSDFTRRRVPPELEALCVKCLARDPAQRYPSVFHVRHILKSWLSRPEMWELYRASF